MEPRKIIQFGNSSYVITLPLTWIKKYNLNKGDIVNLAENEDSIILSLEKETQEKTAIISLDDMPLKLFNKELISYYLKNYKYLKITCEDCIEKLDEIRVLKEKLSSVEITEIHKDYILLKDLTSPAELNIHKLIGEIIEMEKILFQELRKDGDRNKQFLISSLDSNINKLTFLAYKAINYNLDVWKNPNEVKDTIHYRRLVASFERVGDIIKRLARYLKSDKKYTQAVNLNIENLENYFTFLTSLIEPNPNLDNNLKIYLDKKQSLLREFEDLRVQFDDDINQFLVITQLFKDIVGQLDTVVLSVIDLNCN